MQIPARREFKYLVPQRELPALRRFIEGVCVRDKHAGADGTYRLRSLYFDDAACNLFQAKEREAALRFNVRIRSYPDTPSAPVFAEVKGRSGDIIRKTRGPLPPEAWAKIVAGEAPGALASPGLDNFLARVYRHDLRPVVLLQYRREAWMSRLEEYGRLSIDTEIVCQPAAGLSNEGRGRWRPVDTPLPTWTAGSVCVVELKFAEVAPRWMVDLVQHLEMLRHAFSKYSFSMLALASDHHVDERAARSPWVAA